MDHLVLKLTSSLTDEWEIPPSPYSIVVLYKSLVVLHFVCTHCSCIMDYVKTYYHEEASGVGNLAVYAWKWVRSRQTGLFVTDRPGSAILREHPRKRLLFLA